MGNLDRSPRDLRLGNQPLLYETRLFNEHLLIFESNENPPCGIASQTCYSASIPRRSSVRCIIDKLP
jgi:hypothetical protein